MTTQPAGEHHTGTLNLAGEGNEAELASPISDELADLVLAVKERGVPCPPKCDYQTHRRAEVRAELEAALPALRRQIAEEIAEVLERREDDARRAETTEGIAGNKGAAQTWHDLAAGYMRSVELAREHAAR